MHLHELDTYFAAEKHGAALLVALSLAGVALGVYLRLSGSSFRAMAWPLFVIALAQAGIGMGLLVRTGPQVARLKEGLASTPRVTVEAEIERMRKVNRAWVPVETVEVGLIVLGVVLAVAGRSRSLTLTSVGLGLLLEASALLAFDLFAEHRALVYTDWLGHLALKASGVSG